MVLHSTGCGRVGHRRNILHDRGPIHWVPYRRLYTNNVRQTPGTRRISWPSHLCAKLRKGPPCRNRTTVGNPSAATTPSADSEAAATIGATAVLRVTAAVGAATTAVDATAGSRAKAAPLGADRATTAATVMSSGAGIGVAARIADIGTGATPIDVARPKGGRSGGTAATTHRGAIRATGPGTTAAETVAAANAVLLPARTVVVTAGPVIAMTGAVANDVTGGRRTRTVADLAARVTATTGEGPATGADTTTPAHRTAVDSAATATVPNPAGARTSATSPVATGAPPTMRAVDATTAAVTIATRLPIGAVSGGPRTRADSGAPPMTPATGATLNRAVSADATVTPNDRAAPAIVPAGSGVPRMILVAAAMTVGMVEIRAGSVVATAKAGGRAAPGTVPAGSVAPARNHAAGAAVGSVDVSTKADVRVSPSVDTAGATTRATRAIAAVVSVDRTTDRRSAPSPAMKRRTAPTPAVTPASVVDVTILRRPAPKIRSRTARTSASARQFRSRRPAVARRPDRRKAPDQEKAHRRPSWPATQDTRESAPNLPRLLVLMRAPIAPVHRMTRTPGRASPLPSRRRPPTPPRVESKRPLADKSSRGRASRALGRQVHLKSLLSPRVESSRPRPQHPATIYRCSRRQDRPRLRARAPRLTTSRRTAPTRQRHAMRSGTRPPRGMTEPPPTHRPVGVAIRIRRADRQT